MSLSAVDLQSGITLGKQLDARYVVYGSITSLSNKKLLLVSMVDTENLHQIAGDIQTYTACEELEDKAAAAARNIADALNKTDWLSMQQLVVTPVRALTDATIYDEADTLAQILTVYLVKSGKYAVYQSSYTLEQVQNEYDRPSKAPAARHQPPIDRENKPRALSFRVRSLSGQVTLSAMITDLESGLQEQAKSLNYHSLDDGMPSIERLALRFTGQMAALASGPEEVLAEAEAPIPEQTDLAAAAPVPEQTKEAKAPVPEQTEAAAAPTPELTELAAPAPTPKQTETDAVAETQKEMEKAVAAAAPQAVETQTEREAQTPASQEQPNAAKTFSLDVNIGSAFGVPWGIFGLNGTFAALPYTFFDLGVDLGLLADETKIKDYKFSLYPYSHFNLYLPLGFIRLYAGIGTGFMLTFYKSDEVQLSPLLDLTGGLYLYLGKSKTLSLKLAYSFRTPLRTPFSENLFVTKNQKAAAGVSLWF
jgi:hypothetical protein